MLKIYKMTQEELFKYLEIVLKIYYSNVVVKEKYIYAEGNLPVMLISHTDTVHKKTPFFIKKHNGRLSAKNGLGADDRAGVTAILKIIELGYLPSVLFCADEETGGIGANQASKDLNPQNINILIEFDRRGSNEYVIYGCDNPDMNKWVESFGFKQDYGSFSDISILAPAWGIGAVNLSIGYYNAHTKDEYLVIDEWKDVIKKAIKMLNNLPDKKFKYIGKKYSSYSDYDYGEYPNTLFLEVSSEELELYDDDIDWQESMINFDNEMIEIAKNAVVEALIKNKHKFIQKGSLEYWNNFEKGWKD